MSIITLMWRTSLPLSYQQVLAGWVAVTLLFTLITRGEFNAKLFIYSTVTTFCIWQVPYIVFLVFCAGCFVVVLKTSDSVTDTPRPDKSELLFPEREKLSPDEVSIHKINGHTIQIEARGKSFIIGKDPDGAAYVQDVDKNGKVTPQKLYGAPNAWRFGSSPNSDLMKYILEKLNK